MIFIFSSVFCRGNNSNNNNNGGSGGKNSSSSSNNSNIRCDVKTNLQARRYTTCDEEELHSSSYVTVLSVSERNKLAKSSQREEEKRCSENDTAMNRNDDRYSLDDSLDEAIDSLTADDGIDSLTTTAATAITTATTKKENMISERMKMTNDEPPAGACSIKFTHLLITIKGL